MHRSLAGGHWRGGGIGVIGIIGDISVICSGEIMLILFST